MSSENNSPMLHSIKKDEASISRIAVIGSGISGLAAAYYLSRRHDVFLFERQARLGLGLDVNDQHFKGKPGRVARLYQELTRGYNVKPSEISRLSSQNTTNSSLCPTKASILSVRTIWPFIEDGARLSEFFGVPQRPQRI